MVMRVKVVAPVMKIRAFQLMVKERHGTPDVVMSMFSIYLSLSL